MGRQVSSPSVILLLVSKLLSDLIMQTVSISTAWQHPKFLWFFSLGFTLSILVELNNLRDPAVVLLPILYKVVLQEANMAVIDSIQNPVSRESRFFLAIIVKNLNFLDPYHSIFQ
jgi:hypothetical protein